MSLDMLSIDSYLAFRDLLTPMDTSWLDEDINPRPSAEAIYKQFNENTLKILNFIAGRPTEETVDKPSLPLSFRVVKPSPPSVRVADKSSVVKPSPVRSLPSPISFDERSSTSSDEPSTPVRPLSPLSFDEALPIDEKPIALRLDLSWRHPSNHYFNPNYRQYRPFHQQRRHHPYMNYNPEHYYYHHHQQHYRMQDCRGYYYYY